MVSSSRSLPFLLTRVVVRSDIPDVTDVEVEAAAAKVQASIEHSRTPRRSDQRWRQQVGACLDVRVGVSSLGG
jgi:hypothetical protein